MRREGALGLGQRIARAAYRRLDAGAQEFPLLAGDIADSAKLDLPLPEARPERGRPLTIGWVMSPPGAGSGGHTTLFRMVQALESAGHECQLYLYNRYGGDLARHEAVIRGSWPWVKAAVRDLADGFDRLDGCVATSWQTAHVMAQRPIKTRRLYFVQDFEPFFYPRGYEYALAEDSYRFGYRCIAVGHMVADLLRSEVGVEADIAEFGCDTNVYRLTNRGPRSGVVFYAKPGTARRGYELGVGALTEFHRIYPEQPILVYGLQPGALPFTVTRLGTLPATELNTVYNTAIAGLALSFTNISLVAEEMLAAGVIPIVNDSPLARADLHSPYAHWARPTPAAVADALSELVSSPDIPARAAAAARSVRQGRWEPAQKTALVVIEDEIYG